MSIIYCKFGNKYLHLYLYLYLYNNINDIDGQRSNTPIGSGVNQNVSKIHFQLLVIFSK